LGRVRRIQSGGIFARIEVDGHLVANEQLDVFGTSHLLVGLKVTLPRGPAD
jgi:hypothetical protein